MWVWLDHQAAQYMWVWLDHQAAQGQPAQDVPEHTITMSFTCTRHMTSRCRSAHPDACRGIHMHHVPSSCTSTYISQQSSRATYPLILQCLGVLLLGSTIDLGEHRSNCFSCSLHVTNMKLDDGFAMQHVLAECVTGVHAINIMDPTFSCSDTLNF